MLGSTIAPAFIKKFGLRSMLILGSIAFTLVVISQVLPAMYQQSQDEPGKYDGKWFQSFIDKKAIQTILVASAVISGLGAAFIWVSQGAYMSMCTHEQTKGFYFGYFWVWYMSAQIIGNLAGAILILDSPGPNFFFIMGIFSFFVCFGFCFIKTPMNMESMKIDLPESLDKVPMDAQK
jgi:MFS family permease